MNITTERNNNFRYKDGSHIFFTSDTHFGHENIVKCCGRPFDNVSHMDEELIRRWNETVGPDDIIFHLGDFAWGGSAVWNRILPRLNGHIHLIAGNHDEKNIRSGYEHYFESISYQQHIYVEEESIYLNHYPFLCFGGIYKSDSPTWQLFGHVHTNQTQTGGEIGKDISRLGVLFPTQYDVGVDNNDYRPISFYEVKNIIEKQKLAIGKNK